MRGDGEVLVVIEDVPYTLRLMAQPVDRLGRPVKTYLNEDCQTFDVMQSLRLDEWLPILAQAMKLPPGPVIWSAMPMVPVDA